MNSILNVPKYAGPPQENIMVRDEYWAHIEDDRDDEEEVFEEDDIDPMDRCLEITVDVKKWAVDLVYPEF